MNTKSIKFTVLFTIMIMTVMAGASIDGTAHDLSAVPGGNKCSFCHTPHGAVPGTALWNRELSTAVYKIYQSSSVDADIGQPTGSSKLCLSCHDGTIAMNSTFDNPGGTSFIQSHEANLGTDLSDDHPISFYYSPSISAKDPQIKPASSLPDQLRLDKNQEIQCTTCHDPHEDKYGGKMLTMSNLRSQLCLSCHDLDGWTESVHSKSGAIVGTSTDTYLRNTGFDTVEANGCQSCHRLHSAGRNEYLLHFAETENNCLSCHDGTVAKTDLTRQLQHVSRHDVRGYEGDHEPYESALSMKSHVECTDCHNPHAVRSSSSGMSAINGVMWKVSGVTEAGTDTTQAVNEYNVCFKCHGTNPDRIESEITRQFTQTNTLLEFAASAISYHPVITPGTNRNVPSLRAPLTVNSMITCTDCHNSDSTSTVKGPHGSIYRPLLKFNYETQDFTAESEFVYRLCYECHSRNSILADQSFPYHSEHLAQDTPCSACHDAHGVDSAQGNAMNNTHLINFDINIVQQNPDNSKREFVDMGTYHGKCSLMCHENVHDDRSY